jgi:hypothetical protein
MLVLGGSLMFDGRVDEAMAVPRQQIELNPNHANAYVIDSE